LTPKNFDGKIVMNPGNKPCDVWFFRRETEKYTLEEFLDHIKPEDIAWDKPTNQLYYKDCDGQIFKLNFQNLKS
jgi:hypothetical protein